MIIISEDIVFSETEDADTNSNAPLIGWHNLVTVDNITASSEDADFPAVNLANPITAPSSRWRAGDDGAQTLEFEVQSVEEIDYIAIARHNFGTNQKTLSVEGQDGSGSPTWFELIPEFIPPNDAPLIMRYPLQSLTHVRLSISEGGSGIDRDEIAVVYVGKLLPLQRRIYVGHVPMPYGRGENIVNGKSVGGDFLGRIILSEDRSTQINLKNLKPLWYRQRMDPFIAASKEVPFFFAWRPGDYPNEVGFGWVINSPQPENQLANGMMKIDISVEGIAP